MKIGFLGIYYWRDLERTYKGIIIAGKEKKMNNPNKRGDEIFLNELARKSKNKFLENMRASIFKDISGRNFRENRSISIKRYEKEKIWEERFLWKKERVKRKFWRIFFLLRNLEKINDERNSLLRVKIQESPIGLFRRNKYSKLSHNLMPQLFTKQSNPHKTLSI